MTRVTVDDVTRAQLADRDAPVELFDVSGRLLGFFHPAMDDSLYENYEPPISEEEVVRLSHQRGGRTLAEIMADLEKRS
jgi:hypothetical protein